MVTLSTASAESIHQRASDAFERDAHQICSNEWSTRGVLDEEMYRYCVRQHAQGYSLITEFQKYEDEKWYSETALPHCANQWTSRGVINARMLAYCLELELEGVKDYLYYTEQGPSAAIDQIAAEALTRHRSWNMVAYEIELYLD